jgi:hypothetical protein
MWAKHWKQTKNKDSLLGPGKEFKPPNVLKKKLAFIFYGHE